MDGSDTDFSDLGEVDEDKYDATSVSQSFSHNNQLASSVADQRSTYSSTQAPPTTPSPTSWSSTLKPVCYNQPIYKFDWSDCESPLEVFRLFFTSNLQGEIVKQSNLHATEVIGDDKF